MNTPDQHRCMWATAGERGLRCMCPATLSTSQFCVFHRHANAVDAFGIVEWSQNATVEEYLERAKALVYGQEAPAVAELRARIERHRKAPIGAQLEREPGQDEELAAWAP